MMSESSSPRKARATELNAGSVKSERIWYAGGHDFEPLSKKFKQLASQWHATNNGQWTAHDFSSGSDVIAWWQCEAGSDHVWQAAIFSRAAGKGCPFCSNKRVSITNSLVILFPQVAQEWHPTLNDGMSAAEFTCRSKKKSGGFVAIIANINGRQKFLDERTVVVAPIALIREPVERIAWPLNFPISRPSCTQLRMVSSVLKR